jgi:hypothetical protein
VNFVSHMKPGYPILIKYVLDFIHLKRIRLFYFKEVLYFVRKTGAGHSFMRKSSTCFVK